MTAARFLSAAAAATCLSSPYGVPTALAFSAVPGPGSGGASTGHQPPPFPHPSSPEEVVQNQLHFYQTSQLARAFEECCSPGNREATGSVEEFERSLETPPYDLIRDHARADVLMEVRPDAGVPVGADDDDVEVAACLVRIRPNRDSRRDFPVWFWWEVSRVVDDETDEEGYGEARWMVDCIVPDFDDLDFETESLTIENFLGEGDDDGDDDELTIYLDFDE